VYERFYRLDALTLATSLNITFQFPRVFRTRTPPEGQYSYSFSIGWTIEYEYHFIEYEYEICPEMWVKMRLEAIEAYATFYTSPSGDGAPNHEWL
jgi:hypothetical protein